MITLPTTLSKGPMTRQVIVVGDKVLIKPEEEASKTPSGLYLPQGVAEKEAVFGGYIVNVGPGYPTAETADGEPWLHGRTSEVRFVPLQARTGDFALFLRRDSTEVEIDGSKYVIVPHSSILLLIRDPAPLP
jgi:co-chaperonin GroES (HSP10)